MAERGDSKPIKRRPSGETRVPSGRSETASRRLSDETRSPSGRSKAADRREADETRSPSGRVEVRRTRGSGELRAPSGRSEATSSRTRRSSAEQPAAGRAPSWYPPLAQALLALVPLLIGGIALRGGGGTSDLAPAPTKPAGSAAAAIDAPWLGSELALVEEHTRADRYGPARARLDELERWLTKHGHAGLPRLAERRAALDTAQLDVPRARMAKARAAWEAGKLAEALAAVEPLLYCGVGELERSALALVEGWLASRVSPPVIRGPAGTGAGSTAVPTAPDGEAEGRFPAPSAAELARWKADGDRRVLATRAELEARRAQTAKRLAAERERLIAATAKEPLAVRLSKDLELHAQVTEYTEAGVKLTSKNPQLEAFVFWDTLPAETAVRLRRLAAGADDARGQFELGRFAALAGRIDDAIAAYQRAVALDKSFAEVVPDFQRLRNPPRLVNATRFAVSGQRVELDYRFDHPDEAKDFELAEGDTATVADGMLEVAGKGSFVAHLLKFPIQPPLRLEFGAAITSDWVVRGFAEVPIAGKEPYRFLVFHDTDDDSIQYVAGDKQSEWQKVARGAVLALQLDDRKVTLFANGKALFTEAAPSFREVMPVLGGVAVETEVRGNRRVVGPSKTASGSVRFEGLAIKGKVPASYGARVRNSELALFRRELEEGLKVGREALVEPPPAPRRAALWRAVGGPAFDEARALAVRFAASGEVADLEQAIEVTERSIEAHPDHPGLLLVHAWLARVAGAPGPGMISLRRALELDPWCAEARTALAEQLVDQDDTTLATEQLSRVLARHPDDAEALALRGMLALCRREFDRALDDLELAQLLDPKRLALSRNVRVARHLARGPSWKRTYAESKGVYRVRTEISAAAARDFATELDLMWGEYARVCGVVPKQPRPVDVLVFRTPEAYQTHSELVLDDDAESTLGHFVPSFWEIHLFDEGDLEARRTLYHEAFHHYAAIVMPGLPIWANEGMAEYFGGTRITGGKIVARAQVLAGRLDDFVGARAAGWKPVSFAQLAHMSRARFYEDDAPLLYAQAWTIVHYLFEAAPDEVKRAFVRYLEDIRAGKDPRLAYRAAFTGGADPRAWEPRWLAHVEAMGRK